MFGVGFSRMADSNFSNEIIQPYVSLLSRKENVCQDAVASLETDKCVWRALSHYSAFLACCEAIRLDH